MAVLCSALGHRKKEISLVHGILFGKKSHHGPPFSFLGSLFCPFPDTLVDIEALMHAEFKPKKSMICIIIAKMNRNE